MCNFDLIPLTYFSTYLHNSGISLAILRIFVTSCIGMEFLAYFVVGREKENGRSKFEVARSKSSV